MSVSHVQDAALGSTSSGTSQQTLAFGSQPTVGNYVVVWAWGWDSHTKDSCAFTDTGGNAYTVPANVFRTQAGDLWCAAAWAKVATAGASFTVTATPHVTSSTYNGAIMACAAEFSGVVSSSPQDGTAAGATGTSTTVAPGNMTVTAGSLVVYVGVDDNNTFTGSTPTGFTRVGFQNSGATFEVGEGAYAINPASPTNPSRTITSAKWGAGQFALLAAVTVAPQGWQANYPDHRGDRVIPVAYRAALWRAWPPPGRRLVPEPTPRETLLYGRRRCGAPERLAA